MSKEILSILNELAKISFKIINIYDNILDSITNNKDFSNHLHELLSLKIIEEKLYAYFKNDYAKINFALNYTFSHQSNNLSNKDTLCVIRITKHLCRIHALTLADNPDLITDNEINKKVIDYLINNGYSEMESKSIYLSISPLIEKSVATTLHNILLNEISKLKSQNIRYIYFKRLLYQSFTTSSSFEEELINNSFSFIPNTLNEDLPTIINDSSRIKETIISLTIHNIIDKLISAFIEEQNEENLDEIFYQFKAYAMHLTITDLKIYLKVINLLASKFTFNHEFLTKEINSIIDLRTKSKGMNN